MDSVTDPRASVDVYKRQVFPINLPSGNPGTPSPCVNPEGGHWVKDSVGWWYACADGASYLKGGWFTINGRDYQFGPSGYMAVSYTHLQH